MFRDDRPRVNDDGYLASPPELIVEVAVSSASIDLRDKRRAYCRNGVREYPTSWLCSLTQAAAFAKHRP
jgi:Uma2 family endonuclease